VALAANGDDAGRAGLEDDWNQVAGEGEVAEVVDAELHLEALRGLLLGGRHQAGVVDEDVEALVCCEELLGAVLHRLEVSEVYFEDLGRPGGVRFRDLRDGVVGLAAVSAGEDDCSAVLGQRSGGFEADAAVGAGDQDCPASLVGNVGFGPIAAHEFAPFDALVRGAPPSMLCVFPIICLVGSAVARRCSRHQWSGRTGCAAPWREYCTPLDYPCLGQQAVAAEGARLCAWAGRVSTGSRRTP